MKRPSCLYLEATYSKFCYTRQFSLSFWLALSSKSNISPNSNNSPSETQINQHDERPNKSFSPQPNMILASRKTYQMLSSNSFDLAELEPKQVDHRQI
jgi:hypothetical protein